MRFIGLVREENDGLKLDIVQNAYNNNNNNNTEQQQQ